MNILFYHTNGILPYEGGISRITFNLANILRAQGHNVFFLGARKTLECEYDAHQYFLPNASLFSDENLEYFKHICKDNNIEFIINQTAIAPLHVKFIKEANSSLKIKTISCIHNSILLQAYNYAYTKEFDLRQKRLSLLFYLLKSKVFRNIIISKYKSKYRKHYKELLDCSDRIVLLTEGHKKELEEICNISYLKNVTIIPNCLDPTTENTFSLQHKTNTILWVGTIDFSIKRIDLMLTIWSKIENKFPNWNLQILGSSSMLTRAQEYAKKLNLKNVIFVGRVDPKPYYKEAKIVCVTSTHESFSLVTIEGMSNGCVPIIFNSFPAASYIVEDGLNGYLCKPFDVDDYVEKISKLISEPSKLQHMQMAAKKRSDDFSPDNIFAMWEKLLEGIK